ncbi:MAG: AI-2E family transporter [Polyangiales bacterium]
MSTDEKKPVSTVYRMAPMFWLMGIVASCALVYALRGVVATVFFSFMIAYMLDPVVDWIETKGVKRAGAIAILLAALFLVLVIMLIVLVPMFVDELSTLWNALPTFFENLRNRLEPQLAAYGVHLPTSVQGALSQFHIDVRDAIEKSVKPATMAITSIAGGTSSLIGSIVSIATVPIFAFYLLYEFDDLVASAGTLVPKRYRESVGSVARDINEVLGQFFRGQLIVMGALALLYGVGYALVGVPLALVIGVVAGLVSFIPYVGGATALLLAIFMCLLQWQGWEQIVWVVVVYTLVQALESFVITPKVVGDSVGLSPFVVLVALMVGAGF